MTNIVLRCPRCGWAEFHVEYIESYLHGNIQLFMCLSCEHRFTLKELAWEADEGTKAEAEEKRGDR